MDMEILESVLSEIGMNEELTRPRRSKPGRSIVKTDELARHNDYWRGPATAAIRRYWHKGYPRADATPGVAESPVVDQLSSSSPKPERDSGYCSSPASESSSVREVLPTSSRWEGKFEKSSPEPTVVRSSERRKSESASSDSSEASSSCSSLYEIMDLDVELPNFPIAPLSLMAKIMYPERRTRSVAVTTMRFETLFEQRRSEITTLNEDGTDVRIKYEGQNILNMERRLSPYLTSWNVMTETNIIRYPGTKNCVRPDTLTPCNFEWDDML